MRKARTNALRAHLSEGSLPDAETQAEGEIRAGRSTGTHMPSESAGRARNALEGMIEKCDEPAPIRTRMLRRLRTARGVSMRCTVANRHQHARGPIDAQDAWRSLDAKIARLARGFKAGETDGSSAG
jgi:hypothetical protein